MVFKYCQSPGVSAPFHATILPPLTFCLSNVSLGLCSILCVKETHELRHLSPIICDLFKYRKLVNILFGTPHKTFFPFSISVTSFNDSCVLVFLSCF